MSRREQTTEQIRDSARIEFVLVGPRAFSLQAVAKRAYVSIGSVYERWPNATACVHELVERELAPTVDDVAAPWTTDLSLADLVTRDLLGDLVQSDLRFIVECVFAARDDAALRQTVITELHRLGVAFGARVRLPDSQDAVQWWMTATWLGYALLATSGCPIPSTFPPELAALLQSITSARAVDVQPIRGSLGSLAQPSPSQRTAADDTGTALVEAAAEVIVSDGVDEANTRRIAGAAGVTTGALYRRFAGRGELLDDVLKSELTPERYAWSHDLVTALMSDGGLDAAAAHLADLVARTWTDERSAQLLLELTVAAHTDERVLAGIMREITKVANSREEMLTQFVDAGFIRAGISASTMAWLLQVPPIGMRILASIGLLPSDAELTALMKAYLAFVLSDNDASV